MEEAGRRKAGVQKTKAGLTLSPFVLLDDLSLFLQGELDGNMENLEYG